MFSNLPILATDEEWRRWVIALSCRSPSFFRRISWLAISRMLIAQRWTCSSCTVMLSIKSWLTNIFGVHPLITNDILKFSAAFCGWQNLTSAPALSQTVLESQFPHVWGVFCKDARFGVTEQSTFKRCTIPYGNWMSTYKGVSGQGWGAQWGCV